MLNNKEKEKIIELIKRGYTDYKIGKDTRHSHNTIEPIRKEFFENLKSPKSNDEVNSGSLIDRIRNIINEANEVNNTNQIKEKEKKELEKLMEPLKNMLKSEVDERINTEVEKAVKKNNQEWIRRIEQQYIPKEIVKQIKENYENKLKENNNIIENLINENKKKDDTITNNLTFFQQNLNNKQMEMNSLTDQTRYLENEILDIMKENIYLNNYINYRLEDVLRSGQNELNSKGLILNRQIQDFEKFKNKLINLFNDHLLKMNNVNNYLITREKRIVNVERNLNNLIEWTINKRN